MTDKTIKIIKTIKDFDIAQIADSGQCFRLNRREDGSYSLIARGRYLEILQQEETITFSCDEDEFHDIWETYFDLMTDYGAFKARIESKDQYMQQACAYGKGIRILRQELWEMVITFIISQQNNIPRIKKCVESLCRAFGEKRTNFRNETYYTFPSPEALAGLVEEDLSSCSLGYRNKYIRKTADMVISGGYDLYRLYDLKYEDARRELLKLCGVGIKVAECICLFALHHIDAFPIDTHIQKVLDRHYPEGFPFEKYQGFAGILQQYAFYYDVFTP